MSFSIKSIDEVEKIIRKLYQSQVINQVGTVRKARVLCEFALRVIIDSGDGKVYLVRIPQGDIQELENGDANKAVKNIVEKLEKPELISN